MSDTPADVDEAIRVATISVHDTLHVIDCSTDRSLCSEIRVAKHHSAETRREAAKLAASICIREDVCADCREAFLDRLF